MFVQRCCKIAEARCLIIWSPAQTSCFLFLSATCRSHALCNSLTCLLHVVLNREDSDWRNRHQQIAASHSPFPTLYYSPGSNIVQRLHPVGVCHQGVTSSIARCVYDGRCGTGRDVKGKEPSQLSPICLHGLSKGKSSDTHYAKMFLCRRPEWTVIAVTRLLLRFSLQL